MWFGMGLSCTYYYSTCIMINLEIVHIHVHVDCPVAEFNSAKFSDSMVHTCIYMYTCVGMPSLVDVVSEATR